MVLILNKIQTLGFGDLRQKCLQQIKQASPRELKILGLISLSEALLLCSSIQGSSVTSYVGYRQNKVYQTCFLFRRPCKL